MNANPCAAARLRRFGLSLSLAAIDAAHAARPLRTDDAGVIDPAGCEAEGALTSDDAGASRGRTREGALNCGIGLGSQLGLAYGERREGDERWRGAQLLGKTTLWTGVGDAAPAVALGWALGRTRAPAPRSHHRHCLGPGR